MEKKFERALLLCFKKYSLYNSLFDVLILLSETSRAIDIREKIDKKENWIHSQIFRFPYRLRFKWEKYFLEKINNLLIKEINEYKPDLVMVYNSEFMRPETCSIIKKRAKLIFFMGDSPFYTHANINYLPNLFYADLILAPDSFWLEQLNRLGLHKTSFYVPNIDTDSYHILQNEESYREIPDYEVFYTGTGYLDSWGYKKALLMSKFTEFDFMLFGNKAWKRWFNDFPELRSHFKQSDFIPTKKLNQYFNCSKLIPVDGNPAIINGFHIRSLEALGAGTLPLMEYREDLEDIVFKGIDFKIPFIKDYSKASEIASYYLRNEIERKETMISMREHIFKYYNKELNSQRILELLNY